MSWSKNTGLALAMAISMIGPGFSIGAAAADNVKVEGFIKSRDGDRMVLQTPQSPSLVFLLTDDTNVGQVQGVFQSRRKDMSMAALIPGLKVKVEGAYNEQNELIAKSVSFKGNDLQQAQSVQAGMHETKMQGQQNKEELERHKAELEQHKAELEQHQAAMEDQQQQISAHKAAIDAAVARFGQLDDYYIFDEVTLYFANGKTKVDPKYTPQLLALAEKAKSINGYMIEVKGYASSSGSTALNQQLSEDRADEVTNILIQQGHIPLTRMLAPGAMGESHQVGSKDTEQGEAANRRVVVRVLQNKAIAGI
jgi:OmpA-OmpF porin, OOP family